MTTIVGNIKRITATFKNDGVAESPSTVTFKYTVGGVEVIWVFGEDAEVTNPGDADGVFRVELPLSRALDYDYSWHGAGLVVVGVGRIEVTSLIS